MKHLGGPFRDPLRDRKYRQQVFKNPIWVNQRSLGVPLGPDEGPKGLATDPLGSFKDPVNMQEDPLLFH